MCMLVLAVLALVLFLLTPWLIVPFSAASVWHESPAMFPAVGLLLVLVGAAAHFAGRRDQDDTARVEELDIGSADIGRALWVVMLFAGYVFITPLLGLATSTLIFLVASGRAIGLPWKTCATLGIPLSAGLWFVFVVMLKVSFGRGLMV